MEYDRMERSLTSGQTRRLALPRFTSRQAGAGPGRARSGTGRDRWQDRAGAAWPCQLYVRRGGAGRGGAATRQRLDFAYSVSEIHRGTDLPPV